MTRSNAILAASILSLLLIGCGKDEKKEMVAGIGSSHGIYFDSAVNGGERTALAAALDTMDNLPLKNVRPELLQLLKIPQADGANLMQWVKDRVQYIASEASDDSKLVQLQAQYAYPNPRIFPPQVRGMFPGPFHAEDNAKVVFSNIGLSVYFKGKAEGALYGVKGDGIGTFPIRSPRAGLLMTGSGLLQMIPAEYPNAVRIYNLSILFHEARHSDGNNESTGFPHDDCPVGHRFHESKAPACDHSYNGAYTVGAIVEEAFLRSCDACSTAEKNILAESVIDFLGRRIKDAGTQLLDDAPEGQR